MIASIVNDDVISITEILLIWIVPYSAYLFGIIIRKVVMPNPKSPTLFKQLLLAVPFCLIVVTPLLVTVEKSLTDLNTYLVSIGVIMEHGMLLHETIVKRIGSIFPVQQN